MTKQWLKNHGWVFILIFILIAIDQVSKILIEDWLLPRQSNLFVVIPQFFNFRLAYNTGGGWSIFSEYPLVLFAASTLMIVGLLYYYSKATRLWTKIAIIVIVGGALGNWIDRVLYQHVIDFLQFYPLGYAFPIFNFADMCITLGTIGLLIDSIFEPKGGA